MMDKKEIFRKVGEIIHELNDQYRYLSKTPGNLNELEIELFVANANFLADHIKIIQKLNAAEAPVLLEKHVINQTDQREPAASPEKEKPAPETIPEASEETPEQPAGYAGTRSDTFRFDIKQSGEDAEEHGGPAGATEEKKAALKEEVKHPDPAITAEEPVVKEIIIREKTVSVDTPVKEASEAAPTLNDVIAAQLEQQTVALKYNRQSVTDLKTIISLNDKLLFVKDLFNGYSLAYNEAIELVNRFDSFDAADNFLKNNYSSKNNWSEKQQTVDKFYEVLNRRFMK